MPARLIVNADDFGLTRGVNRAVAELYDAGALRSATLMAAGDAFADAVAIARARPGLGVGCHVVLTDGFAVSPRRRIPSLLARDGRSLRPRLRTFLLALATGQIEEDELEREAVAQIRRLQDAGLTVTHLDTHKHTHILPMVQRALLRAAERTGVRAMRNPFEQPWAFRLSNGSTARTSQIRLIQPMERAFLRQPAIRDGRMRTSSGTIGVSATGTLDETTLRNLVAAAPEGTWELVCHPGYNDAALDAIPTRLRATREVELRALLAVLGHAARGESSSAGAHPLLPEIIHYGMLSHDEATVS